MIEWINLGNPMEESNCRFVRKIGMAKVNDTLKMMKMEKSILNFKVYVYIKYNTKTTISLPPYILFCVCIMSALLERVQRSPLN